MKSHRLVTFQTLSVPKPLVFTLSGLVVLIIAYIIVYQLSPFPEPWSDLFLVYVIVAAAFAAAIFSTKVWRTFLADDKPRVVWKYFSLGWWLWAIAELIWAIYYLFDPEVPAISLADPFWVMAYFLFGAAFLFQFRLVSTLSPQKRYLWTILGSVIALALSLVGSILWVSFNPESEMTWGEAFLTIFYVAADLGIMIAAIRLGRIFKRGLWGQAWLGLLAFVISDALYSYATFSGMYAYSLETGNTLTLVVDLLYLLAYLLIVVGCHMHYLLVRFGPNMRPLPQPETTE